MKSRRDVDLSTSSKFDTSVKLSLVSNVELYFVEIYYISEGSTMVLLPVEMQLHIASKVEAML